MWSSGIPSEDAASRSRAPVAPGAAPRLTQGAVHVWRVALDAWEAVPTYHRLLSPAELERAERLATAELQRRFVLARGAVRRILGAYAGAAPQSIALEPGPHGKPALAGTPELEFNVAHSGELALVAVTAGNPLGIDVERIREVRDADAIAARFFSPAEQAEYAALPAVERAEAFFRCWTRKEAFVKATGEGLSRSLGSFDVTLQADRPACIRRIAPDAAEAARWALYAFQPEPGYEAALAIRRSEAVLHHFALSPE